MKKFRSVVLCLLAALMLVSVFSGCGAKKETITIYSCANETRIALMTKTLEEKFPDYEFLIEYQSTSSLAAKLMAEGLNTDCDIVHDLAYLNLDALNNKGYLADVSDFDTSHFMDEVNVSDNYIIECRISGTVACNKDVMEERNLPYPESYEDLLDPVYKGLISMPDPKSSSTAYMFIKCLVNAWGEEKAFDYFEQLSENVLQFTSSGNGPVNALVQEEVAIGLGMTDQAVNRVEEGIPLELMFFDEGTPYAMYGQTIMAGKDERECVKEVFAYLIHDYLIYESETLGAENVMKDYDFTSPLHPKDVDFSDMSGDSIEEKERLLAMWGDW